MTDIPSVYNPKSVEEKWYKFWEDNKLFHAKKDPRKKPYSIVIPPPNVTGILHMGHALNNTIQDILIRYKKMKGFETLWMPGTDHAGIATQNVVEKGLAKENLKRQDLGREKFLERVWGWKESYGSTIIRQLKKLGCACDWDRTRFTMDEEYSKSVQEVFLHLYKKGLIYRGNYIVNWCPRCQTALSDEEAPHHELEGLLYYIKYGDHIVVATTRPETMLGDVAVAVNPGDERYKKLIGQKIVLPLVGREIPVIADELVDPKFGTGAVKVTPAHDPNDFTMGQNHKIDPILVMNPDGTMNKNAGEYDGMDRFEAREAILEALKEQKLLLKVDKHQHAVGHCYRCHTIVEPYMSKQWFVKMKPLAKPAIEAVKKGKIKFYPDRWTKVYLGWMENIRDWCISRQIWWGHRLPVYYCKSCLQKASAIDQKGIIVSKVKPEKCPDCGSTDIYQDEDVLDTWFSSWLWPFATFGWPFIGPQSTDHSPQTVDRGPSTVDKKDLNYFYPTSTLVTAQEIIFFWVARMIMAGLEFQKNIPFSDVYIHGTVRDDTGKKMSKSLGNIIDPLEIIDEFGTDALRFSMISITSVGQDVFLSKQKFELGRNFANKIWNASRFIMMNLKSEFVKEDLCVSYNSPTMNLADKWILSRFYQMLGNVEAAVDSYRFNDAASTIYEFFWGDFCDWYIEFSKPYIGEAHTQIVLYKVLEKSLRVLHPLMPFITEEVWQLLESDHQSKTPEPAAGDQRPVTIMLQPWPHMQKQMINKKIDAEMQVLMDVITAIRNIRATWNVNLSTRIDVEIKALKAAAKVFTDNDVYIKNLARAASVRVGADLKKPPKSASAVVGADIEIYIPLEAVIDFDKEKARLEKEIDGLETYLNSLSAKLQNQTFTSKAPRQVVEKERAKESEIKEKIARLKANL